jgi:hypothetical protein
MTTDTEASRISGIAQLAGGAAVLVAAFVLTTKAGLRGFYPFDQSIVFDGSWRVLSGQIPYKDFLMPFGPVTFWLHSVFFGLIGVDYRAYVFGAAVINTVAALAAMLTVRMVFPRPRFLYPVAGILTAVWFYPPFGTPWVDQTAFFFDLLALALVIRGLSSDGNTWRRSLWLAASGCLAVLAFLSKQNAGAFMAPVFPLLIVVRGWGRPGRAGRDIGLVALGAAATVGGFAVWLVTMSDPSAFGHYFFTIPSALGRERLTAFLDTGFGMVRPFFGGRGPLVMLVGLWVSLAVSLGALIVLAVERGRIVISRMHITGAVLAVYLLAFQHVFINTTLNQPENALGFSGLIIALAAGLLLTYTPLGKGKVRIVTGLILALFISLASAAGYKVAMRRDVHEMLRGARFGAPVSIPGLEGLRWGEPTLIRGTEVRPEHLAALYDYLNHSRRNFFIFPDFTLFYGLLGRPSPQPLLWFHEGVTYSREDNGPLDARIVAALELNKVTVYIREQSAWFDTGARLDDFPLLRSYLREDFHKVGEIGIFSVYERNPAEIRR